MTVVHLSWSDLDGGAARAAWRTHDALRAAGVDSSMFVGLREGDDPYVRQYSPAESVATRLGRIVRRERLRSELRREARNRPAGFEHFRDDRTQFGADVSSKAPPAAIYHLHQVTDFVDYAASLGRLAKSAPLVWTLHEMSPFTGGCHYAYECDGFTRECGTCPQLGSDRRGDLSHRVWTRKRSVFDALAASRIQIVAASNWMAAEAARSGLFGRFTISVVPYGLDTQIFRPTADARRLLPAFGLDPASRIVLFVADYSSTPRKGFHLLNDALSRIPAGSNCAVISVGRGPTPNLSLPLRHAHLGSMTSDRMLAAIYSMADVFVIPSIQDNLPNTVIEAMSCGTPVVGFRVGGIPDMIRDGETGLLAAPGDTAGLASAIDTLIRDQGRRHRMGAAGRAIAEREYSRELHAARYVAIYEALQRAQESVRQPRRSVRFMPWYSVPS